MKIDTQVIALPLTGDRLHLSEHFGEAPYFLLLTLKSTDGGVLKESWLNNPFRSVEKGKGIQVSEWLVSLGIDEVITAKSFAHKGPYYVFSDNEVEMQQTEERDIDEIKGSLVGSHHGENREVGVV
jgi:predicted Fe-Mo cluster-binding NifX family protein